MLALLLMQPDLVLTATNVPSRMRNRIVLAQGMLSKQNIFQRTIQFLCPPEVSL